MAWKIVSICLLAKGTQLLPDVLAWRRVCRAEDSNSSDPKYGLGCRAVFAAAVRDICPLSDQHRTYLS